MAATTAHEIADGIFRISTGVEVPPPVGAFTFNQFLVVDEEPLLFHTGPRALFPATLAAIERVLPPSSLRWVAWSHHEADESGALGDFLALAPRAAPACSAVGAMISASDMPRPPRALAEGDVLRLGRHELVWMDAPHVPHGWDCGFLFERTTRTLLCGDLFTQVGPAAAAVTERDVLGPSEAARAQMDYYAHGPATRPTIERLAALGPRTLACMHGSSFRGDGAAALRALAAAL
jgi:flavorubredoxin